MASGELEGAGGSLRPGVLTAVLEELAAAPPPEAEPGLLAPGTAIGRFEVIRELGRGAFGVVYEARDRELLRSVALKIVRPGRAGLGAAQLAREAEAIARLSHPNLVTLHEAGRSEHGPYLVFELLRGRTLHEHAGEGPLPVGEAVRVATEIARGLAHAHAEGVVHRDLKPTNAFVTAGGGVKLLDFGMAHAFGRRRVSGGTPAYMAPEQWAEDPEDERTDVFALGVMLHRLLSGEYPYPEQEGRWASGEVGPSALHVPGAPELEALVERMVRRAPRDRPRDGGEVLEALEEIGRTHAGSPTWERAGATIRRRRATLGALVEELRRRRVPRVLVGYGFFAVAALLAAEPVMRAARLPEEVLPATLAALLAGLPVTIALAWVFDVGRDGIRRTPSRAGAPRVPRPWALAGLAAVTLAAALPLAGLYAWRRDRLDLRSPPAARAPAGAEASVAVLPFADLSPARDQEYFADGVAEEILSALTRVEGLRVVARASSFWFKGKGIDQAEIGRRLGVAHLLEGSVRRAGDRLRVSAELIRAGSGERVWGESYDRAPGDAFAVQEEIARAVAAALRVKLAGGKGAPAAEAGTRLPEAYDAYLRGVGAQKAGTVAGLREAVGHYQRALALDPRFALAHVRAAGAYRGLRIRGASAETNQSERREHVYRALALAPELGEAHAQLALLLQDVDEAAAAGEQYRRALALDPGRASTHTLYAWYLGPVLGRHEEALVHARRATELDPLSAPSCQFVVTALDGAGRPDEASAQNDVCAARFPDSRQPAAYRGLRAAADGDLVTSLTVMRDWAAHDPEEVRSDECFMLQVFSAAAEFRTCVERRTREAPGSLQVALLAALLALRDGRPEQALEAVDRASVTRNGIRSMALLWMGRPAQTVQLAELENPALAPGHDEPLAASAAEIALVAAEAHLALGDRARAEAILRRLLPAAQGVRRGSFLTGSAWNYVVCLVLLGEREQAYRALEERVRDGVFVFLWDLEAYPGLAAFRRDPRFEAILAPARARAAEQVRLARAAGLLD